MLETEPPPSPPSPISRVLSHFRRDQHVNLAVIRLRFTHPKADRTFRIPFAIGATPVTAVLGIGTIALMAAYLRPEAWILGALMLLSGIGAWLLGGYLGRQPS